MWEKITAALGLVLAFIMAIFLGKSQAQKKQAEKEVKETQEQMKKEAEYKEKARQIKDEIFKENENEKQKLNTGDNVSRFNAINDLLRKH